LGQQYCLSADHHLTYYKKGIQASSHYSRSLEDNRRAARSILQQKIDHFYNKEESLWSHQLKEKQLKKAEKSKRAIDNLKRKQEFKERESE
jgi:hypothetical protein